MINTDSSFQIQNLKDKYARVFNVNTMGKIKNIQAELKLKVDHQPVFKKSRQVPFSIKLKIEDELDNLEKN